MGPQWEMHNVPSVLIAAVRIQDDNLLERLLDEISTTHDLREPSCLCLRALDTAIHEKREYTIQVFLRRGINLSSPCAVKLLNTLCDLLPDSLPSGASVSSVAKTLLAAGVPFDPLSYFCTDESCGIGDDLFGPPLTTFAYHGEEEMVQLLLDYGADPRRCMKGPALCSEHKTALENAAGRGHEKIVDMLLDAGADVNQPPSAHWGGRIALQSAVEHGRSEIIDRLLRAGADVNAPPAADKGITALQAAALQGFLGIAVKLLELGADINAPGAEIEGRTALEGAAEHGRIDMVQLLLGAGADIRSLEFGVGQYDKVVKRARENGHNALARLLEKRRRSS